MPTPPTLHHLSGLDPGLLHAVTLGHARLSPAQALQIFHEMPLSDLGRWADARCRAVHGDSVRTYIIDRNINYTNVCNAKCTFCAFRRDPDDHDAYTLSTETIHQKIAELTAIGGTQILMQGGMNPALPLSWYTDLLQSIKTKFPRVHVHAFSPPEMIEFVHFFDPPGNSLFEKVRWVLLRLKDAGLDSLPGGGGEIFADPVRKKIGLGKCDAESWLTVMHAAHSLGMFTSATMMFGHVEGTLDRIHHMELVRRWQDRSLAARSDAESSSRTPFGHYVSFISWPFQRENTPLGRVPGWAEGANEAELNQEFPGDAIARAFVPGHLSDEHLARFINSPLNSNLPKGQRTADVYDFDAIDRATYPTAHLFGKRVRMSGSTDYLRTQALSRLYLDNIYSIGASWVTMGPHIGQVALAYGANDMGSVMMEENVVSSAGTTYCLDEPVLCKLIRDAGHTPAQRNNTYDIIRLHNTDHAPDRQVTDWSKHRAKKMHQQAPKAAKQTTTGSPVQLTVTTKP
ncbi:MAG: radical SAM protein [Phycisphaerales bacterium]|nr:radical SAM protein [Phycisphaerales bacterium]